MNKEEFKFKTSLIKEQFYDERKIICPTPRHQTILDDNVHPGGDIFTTENGEFIDFEIQVKDFDEEELTKYVEFAENLYEKHKKKVSVYILCPKDINVTVKECPLKSEAEFNIKISCLNYDSCHLFLNIVKRKLKNRIPLDGLEIHFVEMLPIWCAKKDRHYFRLESIKIMNMLD